MSHLASRRVRAETLGLLLSVSTLACPIAWSAEFYVDPVAGSPAGDGSAAQPWQTLQQVVDDGLIETQRWEAYPYAPGAGLVPVNEGAPVQPGDTLWLADGFHGEFNVSGAYNAETVSVLALPGQKPQLSRILVRSAQRWRFSGLTVSPSFAGGAVSGGDLVRVENHSFHGPASDVEFSNGEAFTVDDASTWDAQAWIDEARSGLYAAGAQNVTFRNNLVRNVRHGITASGGADGAVVIGNTVDGFSADGMRGLSSNSRFEYNVVRDAYVGSGDGDSNHDDGFQSWSVGEDGRVGTGEVRNNVLRGNLFINYTDPNRPYRATLQGIGCFDGFFVNWTVENNVVIVDHWHGITFMGMRDSRVINNTLIDLNDTNPGPPWVRIVDHKDGRASENVIVRNNLTPSVSLGDGVIADHNLEYSDAGTHFVAAPYDLRLLANSAAVDAGSADGAPVIDRDGISRPQSSAPDIGAYEYCADCAAVLFADGFEGL